VRNLGLSPSSRNRMGLGVPDAEPEPDWLDELKAQHDGRRETLAERREREGRWVRTGARSSAPS
jgi:hypothetical protein